MQIRFYHTGEEFNCDSVRIVLNHTAHIVTLTSGSMYDDFYFARYPSVYTSTEMLQVMIEGVLVLTRHVD